jgi:hypothetical protein
MHNDNAHKHFFYCEQAYTDTQSHRPLKYPDWIQALKAGKQSAKTAHLCLQAAVLSLLNRKATVYRSIEGDVPPNDLIRRLALICDQHTDDAHLMGQVFIGLRDAVRLRGELDELHSVAYDGQELDPLHALSSQAAEQSAAAVTPAEVVKFMAQLAQTNRMHAYALDGLGLIYGAPNHQMHVVGDEFRSGSQLVLPAVLDEVFTNAHIWFKPAEFANRAFLELEKLTQSPEPKADSLLVNAARLEFPFYPRELEDEDMSEQAGVLNPCLSAGYTRVVVLVSNHYLTAGRGRAANILRYCLQHGLEQIIQLPLGVLGLRSQAHSILVFCPGKVHQRLDLTDLSDKAHRRAARKGFGRPRRAFELVAEISSPRAQSFSVSVDSLLQRCSGEGQARRMVSFEVGQFSQEDPLLELRGTYDFSRFSKLLDVFRSHHIVETGDQRRARYSEIGASNITPEGEVMLGKEKDCAEDALGRRKAQILQDGDIILCFRGAPDSFAKVGLYRHKPGVRAVPNQSFVIIRRKTNPAGEAPAPALILWWLKSTYAQSYLKKKAIVPDVMRIAPRDIAALEMPCGPPHLIARELETLEIVGKIMQKVSEYKNELAQLSHSAWRTEAQTISLDTVTKDH